MPKRPQAPPEKTHGSGATRALRNACAIRRTREVTARRDVAVQPFGRSSTPPAQIYRNRRNDLASSLKVSCRTFCASTLNRSSTVASTSSVKRIESYKKRLIG